jgi:hypothetical protein
VLTEVLRQGAQATPTTAFGSRNACPAMVHQLMQSASKRWRLLNEYDLLPDVIAGVQFANGVKSQEVAAYN